MWPKLIAVAVLFRIDEASNPGPEDSNFVLGAFNPSGLKGKAPYIVSQLAQGDIWAVTETHLCSQSLSTFRSALHFAQSPFRYFVGGHPVPAQNNRVFHAAWRGVGVLSKFPTREVPTQIPAELCASSRLLITTTLVHDCWVTGGTVYGEPESSSYPQAKQNNESLLHHVAGHVCHLSKGPRYVAGDWNILQNSTPAFDILENAGFRDLQDLACDLWGQPIINTCKNATRKDFCYVSRELQFLLHKVVIQQDVFPDHAVIWGEFRPLSQVLPRQVWISPSAFPWPKHWEVDHQFWNNKTIDCDERYRLLWQHIEQQACSALPFPVAKNATGRAATTEVRRVTDGKISPPKKGRTNDVKPHYVCATFRHAQWLRQLRRLQAYVRHVSAQDPHTPHAKQVWGAILRATGFLPSFQVWWDQCPFRMHGAPEILPVVPPEAGLAILVFESFALAFRSFEQELQSASRQYARQSREQNPNAIFRDLRAAHAKGVEALVKPVTAKVIELRPEECMLVLDKPVSFDAHLPVNIDGVSTDLIHAEADAIWVEPPEPVCVGSNVSQIQCRGTDDELFTLFIDAWRQMWGRHQQVPPSRWDTILQFARAHLQFQPLAWPAIDVHALQGCIAQKHNATTAGLDGVTLADLRALPRNALSNFVDLFLFAERTGCWPQQMLAGRVTCIPKKESPEGALDFRPITVIGLLYRCWSTFQARHAIRAIESVLPVGLFGSRPNCYAGQVWSQLLFAIELAYEQGTPLCGVIADIQKAFNFLPRAVVMESCALLGIPFDVLRGWSGALAAMPRRFQINGSLSAPAYSTCGLPEGCALSCLGMMVIDILFHKWMTHFFPMCQPVSYVDDWQVLVTDPQRLQPVFNCLEEFTRALDLLVDQKKTHTWSISAEGRKCLRAQGLVLVSFDRNLGAHVQFSRQHTNRHLLDRVTAAGPLWQKLRLSTCAYTQKIRALKTAAWPRCLHAVAATTVSNATFTSLRANAMKGLRADSAGANSMVHLGLIEAPTVDPQVWALTQTFRLVRDCGTQARVEQVLAELVADQIELPSNSITNTLLKRIQTLGWNIDCEGRLVDMLGPFSLFQVSSAELQYRVGMQWLCVVQDATVHRSCFQGLGMTDPEDTRHWLQQLSVADRALFRKLLNGTHITQDGKHYCQEVDTDVCPFCLCSDSRFHRFWQCERFSHLRNKLPPAVLDAALELPNALICSGWSMAPTTLHDWNQYFAQLPDIPVSQCHFTGVVHLFTDGSCHGQHNAKLRFAGWAVVFASAHSVHDCAHSHIAAAGVLPGLLQSAIRAEIYAVLKAIQIAQDHPGLVMLWSDCDAVVRRVRRMLQGNRVKPNSSHSDLWQEVQNSLLARRGDTQITRVAAHQSEHQGSSVFDEWCFRHNALADRQAVQANLTRPPQFWQLYHRHALAVDTVAWYNREVQNFLLAVSKEVVRNDEPAFIEVAADPLELAPPSSPWRPLPALHIPSGAVRWYGDSLVRLLLSWFWQVVDGSSVPLCWVSHFQLYIDFMCSTGHPGPFHLQKWCDGSELPFVQLRGFAFRQRSRWFAKVLKQSLKHAGVTLEATYGRPCSHIIQMFTGCLGLPWPRDRLEQVDHWMLAHCDSTLKRQTKVIDSLPFAARSSMFPPTYVTTIGP